MGLYNQIQEAVSFIKTRCGSEPSIGLILGSGLGDLANSLQDSCQISYKDIPHFHDSTVESHSGVLHLGSLCGKTVCAMQGRIHRYEGYSLQDVTFPVRVMKALGCETLIIVSSVGSVNPSMQPGDAVLISDHINLFGDNPLIGPNDDRLGPRFPDMSEAYSRELIKLMTRVAADNQVSLQRGVYIGSSGPSLETAAEYRMFHRLGADLVGMSTVPEVIVANHAGMKVLGLGIVGNYCDYCNLQSCMFEQIVEAGHRGAATVQLLIPRFLEAMKN